MDAAAAHWHSSLYPLLLHDDFTREEKEENTMVEHGDGSGGDAWGEQWNVEVKNEEEGGYNERSWKESGEVKECNS